MPNHRRNQMAKPETKLVNMSASQVFGLLTKGSIVKARAGVLTVEMTSRKNTTTYIVPINGTVVEEVVEAPDDGEAPKKRRGRPPKKKAADDAPKKRRGRPPKKKAADDAPKKRRGRPPKKKAAAKKTGKRGRPKGSGKKGKKAKKSKKNLLDLKL